MDGLGVIFGVALSVLYPLIIWLLVKKVRYEQESYRYLFAAFILGAAVFYLAYMRKFYVALFSGAALYGIDLVTTGFIEEVAKLLILMIPLIRNRIDEKNGAFYGLVVGLGFGGGEAIMVLATVATSFYLNQITLIFDLMIFNTLLTLGLTQMEILIVGFLVLPQLISEILTLLSVVFLPTLAGIPLLAVYERLIAVLFHASSAAIIGYGLVRGKTLKYYLAAVILHILLNSFALLYTFGVIDVLAVEAIITVFAVALFVYVMYKTVWTVEAS
nr:YhfC family glutamic-type intramembrane protease [Candidatus Freyarchaeota archaeon]